MRIPFLAGLIFLLALPSPGQAAMVDETEIDIQTREIAKTLRCTVCQTENIWESGAPLAHQMREVVRERVKQGQSAEEIRAYFLSRYGDYIRLHFDGTAKTRHELVGLAWSLRLAAHWRVFTVPRARPLGRPHSYSLY